MEIRTLTPADVEAVAAFAERGLEPGRYPLVYSPAKLRAVVTHFMESPVDYHRIAVHEGEVVGILAVSLADMPYFERAEAFVFAFYATRYGVGRELLKGMLSWLDGHFLCMRITWPHNPGMRPAVQRLARMCAPGRRVEEMTMTTFYK